jgi:hypothetical protein
LKVALNTINQNPKIPTTTQSRFKEMVLLYVVIQWETNNFPFYLFCWFIFVFYIVLVTIRVSGSYNKYNSDCDSKLSYCLVNQNPKIPTTTQSRFKEMVLLYVVIQLVMLFWCLLLPERCILSKISFIIEYLTIKNSEVKTETITWNNCNTNPCIWILQQIQFWLWF